MSVTAPQGFVASGIAAGIKTSGALDLPLVATATGRPVSAAGVFTSNKMTAAPVIVSAHHLEKTAGRSVAVILNSGNANAANGDWGFAHAQAMCLETAARLGCDPYEVLVCSTGLIGIPMPIDVILEAIPALVGMRRVDGGSEAAEAIRTTDTVRKEVVIEGGRFTVGGMAKGAAMLAPNMATMLAVLTTDAAVEPQQLRDALVYGIRDSFNALSVDGCTSTNDTVLLLASGLAGPVEPGEFNEAIAEACMSLSVQMAGDAEGATKVVRITVTGARSDEEARKGARKVAESQLCKCSWYGKDPYWGRVASELGSAGIEFEQEKLSIAYGGVTVASQGCEIAHDEAAVVTHMEGRHLELLADLGVGNGVGTILTNDLTHAYVDENMGTS